MDEDDQAGWDNWDVESDSSDESSDGWQDVGSDGGDDLEVSDSDDDDDTKSKKNKGKGKATDDGGDGEKEEDAPAPDPARVSTLATTKVAYSPHAASWFRCSFNISDPDTR